MSNNISHPIRRAGGGIFGLLLLLVIIIAANTILRNLGLRRDLTEQKLYTLSEGTRSYLARMEHPVTLKYFFSRSSTEVPVQLKAYAKQVEDLLREYRSAAGGNIILEFYDPKLDTDEEDLARRHGIAPQNRNPFSPPVYFGLAASFGNTDGAIPGFDPTTENMLEYDITRLIHRVRNPEKPVVGVISSLPVLGSRTPMFPGMPPSQNSAPWLAFQELSRDYTLREIAPEATDIEPDIQSLIIVHPKNLPETMLYAIDQFVLRGGQVLAFVDPFCIAEFESTQQQPFGMPNVSSNMEKLLAAWGIGYNPGLVLADLKASTRLNSGNGQIDDNPVFLTLRAETGQINTDDLLTAKLNVLMIPFGGVLTDATGTNRTFTSLITASDVAGPVDAMTVQMGSQAVRRVFKPEPQPPLVAARVVGQFTTAFPNGRPEAPQPEENEEVNEDGEAAKPQPREHVTEGRGAVIVVADVDLLFNRFAAEELNMYGFTALRPLNDNLTLFANAVEQISGSADLISIRSRGSFARPFEKVLAIETEARERWQEKESALMGQLEQTRQQLSMLQQQKDDSQRFIMSPEQQKALENYRAEELRINRELRDVQKQLRTNIERLGVKIKLINIALVPSLVILTGLGIGLRRKRRS